MIWLFDGWLEDEPVANGQAVPLQLAGRKTNYQGQLSRPLGGNTQTFETDILRILNNQPMVTRREVHAAVGSMGSAGLAGCTRFFPFRRTAASPEIADVPTDWPISNQDRTNTGTFAVDTTPEQAPEIPRGGDLW